MRLCVRHSEADAEAVDGEIERLTLGRYDTDLERWEIFQPGEADDAICVETLRFSLWMIVGAAAPEPAAAGGIGAWWVLVGVGAALFGAGGATLLVRHRGSRRDRPGSVPDTEEEEAPTAHPPAQLLRRHRSRVHLTRPGATCGMRCWPHPGPSPPSAPRNPRRSRPANGSPPSWTQPSNRSPGARQENGFSY